MQQLPKFYETCIPVLNILSKGEELHHQEIRNKVKEKFYSGLSAELYLQKTSTGANTLLDRIGWGLSYLSMSGYVERTKRGYYKITHKGTDTCNKGSLTLEELKNQPEYIAHQENVELKKKDEGGLPQENDDESYDSLTPNDLVDKGISQLESQVKEQLFEKIITLDPYIFEELILRLLKAMGYGETIRTNKSNDGGIDGVVNQDALGLEKIYIQAKRFTGNKVREKDIRDFIGAMSGDTNKGIFVTTSEFDSKAIEKANSAHHTIILIDGQRLVKLMFQYDIGVQAANIRIKELDNDFFDK